MNAWLDSKLQGRSFNVLLKLVVALTIIGFVIVFSATQGLDAKAALQGSKALPFGEFIWEVSGTLGGFFIGYILYFWQPWKKSNLVFWPLIIVLVLMVATMLFGDTYGGATRTLSFTFFSIQPAEFLRLALPVWVSSYLASRWDDIKKRPLLLYYPFIFIFISFYLVYESPDLEAALLTFAIGLIPIIFAGLPIKMIVTGFVAAVIVGLYSLFAPGRTYRLRRIFQWLPLLREWYPETAAALGPLEDYQMTKAELSISLGGIFRFAPGQTVAKYSAFPASSSDFIFVIVIEEYGLFGGLIVLSLFIALAVVCFYLVRNHPTPLGRMLVLSLAFAICGQAFINIGSVVKTLPVSGLNLPLFSTGLSSRVTVAVTLSILLALAKETDEYFKRQQFLNS